MKIGPLAAAVAINLNEGELPQIIFLPERHALASAAAAEVRKIDRIINQEILSQHLKPGDTILLERSCEEEIKPSSSFELQGMELPPEITVRGWDNSQVTSQLHYLSLLFQAALESMPVVVERNGVKQVEVPSTIKGRAARLFLKMQDFSLLGEGVYSREQLPSGGLSFKEYEKRLFTLCSCINGKINAIVQNSFIRRNEGIESSFSDLKGRLWVWGGYKHFVHYEGDGRPALGDWKDAVEKLYRSVSEHGLSAAALMPIPLVDAYKIAVKGDDSGVKLSQKIVNAITDFFTLRAFQECL